MRNLTRAVFAPAMLASAAFFASAAQAEDAAVDKLYGEGVHAFFAHDVSAAHKHLDASIAAGNRDPRCYFYRGLAAWRLGKADAAKADFRQGATLEAANPDMTTMINRSMQRVQGSTRLSIEKFRSDAQLAALAARKQRDAARYGAARASAIKELEKQAAESSTKVDVLPDAAATDATEKPAAADPNAAEPAAKDPFGDDPMTDAGATDPAPMDPAVTDPAPMEEMPAEETPAADPMADPMAEEPKAEEPAAEAPKAEEPKAEEPKTEEPAAAEEPPAGELPQDPFG